VSNGSSVAYRVFVRSWWKRDSAGKVVPNYHARKTSIRNYCTEDEARDVCQVYNANHKPGWQSRKAEYERQS
jgi:hypothetical protein